MISWSSKQQKHSADSSCYAEYIALHHAGKELIFLRELLEGLGMPFCTSTPLHCDNDAAWLLAEDQSHDSHHANVKHIRVKYHSIRDIVEEGLALMTCVHSLDNTTDILTKPLARPQFEHFQQLLGLRFG